MCCVIKVDREIKYLYSFHSTSPQRGEVFLFLFIYLFSKKEGAIGKGLYIWKRKSDSEQNTFLHLPVFN